jgi:hypothetical protein
MPNKSSKSERPKTAANTATNKKDKAEGESNRSRRPDQKAASGGKQQRSGQSAQRAR